VVFEFELPLNFKFEQLTPQFAAIKIIQGHWIGLHHPEPLPILKQLQEQLQQSPAQLEALY
jgi:hypothetical protein